MVTVLSVLNRRVTQNGGGDGGGGGVLTHLQTMT